MSFKKIVEDVLASTGLPYEEGYYTGDATTYLFWNESNEELEGFCDDEPSMEVKSVQIHLVCQKDENYTAIQKSIKKKFKEAGFGHLRVAINSIEDNNRHICYETNYDLESEE